MTKKQIILNVLLAILWTATGAGTVMLLVAAIQKKDLKHCSGIDITIKGVSDNFFVDKNDILNTIVSISEGRTVGKPIGSFDLKVMEATLQKNTWIKKAQLFFDNNERLQVNVLEREPVARVFTTTGTTFYIDSSTAMLPLSEKFSARLPVFTNFPSDKKVLLKADSNLLRDVLTISMAIREDSFDMAMIDQVDITPQRNFEMIPKFGNTVVVFGDALNAAEKLDKLRLFYKEVLVKAGWNKYSEINVQYNNQVVARRKGTAEVKADSLRTLQLMKMIAENAERMAGDSLQTILQDNEHNTTSKSIIQQSIERDDNSASGNTIEEPRPQEAITNEKPRLPDPVQGKISRPGAADSNRAARVIKKPVIIKKPANTSDKPILKQNHTDTIKPKLLMPKSLPKKQGKTNEY
ncbi:MAG: hypothetical protein ABI760_01845 [Ferruginibacter sp.]